MKYVYPATIQPEDEGGFSVWFEDLPGCATQGETLAETFEMAQDALAGWIDCELKNGDVIPPPRSIDQIPTEGKQFVNFVCADLDAYRQANDMRSIRRAVTLPAWLNTRAAKMGVNFSQALQESLYNKLGLQRP